MKERGIGQRTPFHYFVLQMDSKAMMVFYRGPPRQRGEDNPIHPTTMSTHDIDDEPSYHEGSLGAVRVRNDRLVPEGAFHLAGGG